MNDKLVGLLLFDLMLIFAPFLINIAPELVYWLNIILIAMLILNILSMLTSNINSNMINDIKAERSIKPNWWKYYDISSYALFSIIWIMHGFYTVAFVMILSKIIVTIKVDEYWK